MEHQEHGAHYQSYPDYLDYRDRNSTFSGMVAYDTISLAVSTGKALTKNFGYMASGNYFDVLGVQPALGRFFHANDEHGANSAPYIVLSHDFWHTRFSGDPNILGKSIDLNRQSFTVIGVASSNFHGTETFYWPDFWIPIANAPQLVFTKYLTNRSSHNPWILGRLKAGITPQQATDDLNAISRRLGGTPD